MSETRTEGGVEDDGVTVEGRRVLADTDQDGTPDDMEKVFGTDPFEDPNSDVDGDGLTLREEGEAHTDPYSADADGDGLTDAEELKLGTVPGKADSDGDGIRDDAELAAKTDPRNADTDGDGYMDSVDARPTDTDANPDGTNWFDRDTDGDGITDNEESQSGTNPQAKDSDGDGVDDATEYDRGSSPTKADPAGWTWEDPDGDGFDRTQEGRMGTSNITPQTPEEMARIIDGRTDTVFGQVEARLGMGLPVEEALRAEYEVALADLADGSLGEQWRANQIANRIDGVPLDPKLDAAFNASKALFDKGVASKDPNAIATHLKDLGWGPEEADAKAQQLLDGSVASDLELARMTDAGLSIGYAPHQLSDSTIAALNGSTGGSGSTTGQTGTGTGAGTGVGTRIGTDLGAPTGPNVAGATGGTGGTSTNSALGNTGLAPVAPTTPVAPGATTGAASTAVPVVDLTAPRGDAPSSAGLSIGGLGTVNTGVSAAPANATGTTGGSQATGTTGGTGTGGSHISVSTDEDFSGSGVVMNSAGANGAPIVIGQPDGGTITVTADGVATQHDAAGNQVGQPWSASYEETAKLHSGTGSTTSTGTGATSTSASSSSSGGSTSGSSDGASSSSSSGSSSSTSTGSEEQASATTTEDETDDTDDSDDADDADSEDDTDDEAVTQELPDSIMGSGPMYTVEEAAARQSVFQNSVINPTNDPNDDTDAGGGVLFERGGFTDPLPESADVDVVFDAADASRLLSRGPGKDFGPDGPENTGGDLSGGPSSGSGGDDAPEGAGVSGGGATGDGGTGTTGGGGERGLLEGFGGESALAFEGFDDGSLLGEDVEGEALADLGLDGGWADVGGD